MGYALHVAERSPSRSAGRTFSHVPMVMRQVALTSRALLQPKTDSCACGGSCPRCQAKSTLKLGAADDAYEREADAVADRVMRMAGGAGPFTPARSGLQRKCTVCEIEDEEPLVHTKPEPSSASTQGDAATAAPSVITALSSPGQALDSKTRALFEPLFGFDFSGVRVHSDAAAARAARDVSALAYVVGHDIVFARGRFAPGTYEGRRLLAHELTHVVQQSGAEEIRVDRSEQEGGVSPTSSPVLQRARDRRVQRNEDSDWIGSMFDTIEETIGGAGKAIGETIGSAGSKIGTAVDLANYPSCTDTVGGSVPKPELNLWLDNQGLETLRHGEGELLSKSKVPSGGDRGATKLLKQAVQAWGCETLGLDLLPKHGAVGPFGPETAAAVKQVQLFSGLSTDGVVGAQTLAALDQYLGVAVLPAPPTPGRVGGSEVQGESTFRATGSNPVGRIFFPTDGDALDAEDLGILYSMAEAAKEVQEIELVVLGFADKRESATYNEDLADRRAAAVHDRLHELLADREVEFLLSYESLGEIERPQNGDTDEALKPFRRAEVYVEHVIYPAKGPTPEEGNDRECHDLLCVPEQPPEPVCRVDVRATTSGGLLENTPWWHLFIVHTDSSGNETGWRGGPSAGLTSGGGQIIGRTGAYEPGFDDWDPSARSVTVARGANACQKTECFRSELERINGTETPYEVTGPNSNTWAKTVLDNCGLPKRKPSVWAPGFDDPNL